MEMIRFMRMDIERRLAACDRAEEYIQEISAAREKRHKEEMKEKLTVVWVLCGFIVALAMVLGVML